MIYFPDQIVSLCIWIILTCDADLIFDSSFNLRMSIEKKLSTTQKNNLC
jgi:hypothetical protein